MSNNLTLATLAIIFFSSCVGTKTLYTGLTKEQSSLAYLNDSDQNAADKTDTIRVSKPIIIAPDLSISGNLEVTKATAIPLIVYTSWSNEHEYSIGENVIAEDLSTFIQESFITETNRSSVLFADSLTNSDLVLEIAVDSLGARGPYRSQGYVLFLLFAYSYSMSESAGPGLAYSRLSYTFRNNERIFLTGSFSNQSSTEPLVNNFKNPGELRRFFSSNLVEGLSRTLKVNIESIIKEVESYYQANQSTITSSQ